MAKKALSEAGIAIKNEAAKAKIEAENRVSERSHGHPLIGMNVREFEIKATGKGHVKVTITVTPPQPGIPPVVTNHESDVE